MNINENAFLDELALHYLYKRKSINTNDMEKVLSPDDKQLVNNVICNRKNSTSYLSEIVGFLKYDENKYELSITKKGEKEIEQRYAEKRTNKI